MEDCRRFLEAYRPLDADVVLPELIRKNYRVESCLKKGENRSVLLLREVESGARHVLKIAGSAQINRFRAEYDYLMQVHGEAFPHPVMLFEAGGFVYMLREYVSGQTIFDMVEDNGPLPPPKAAEIASQVCGIAEILHRSHPPIIHRDIKPQNFVVSEDMRVRLIDLDAAQAYSPEKSADTQILGTAATAAPEQFGYQRCDPKTDIYAIGMLLVFMLSGRFERDAVKDAEIPRGLRRVIVKCLRFDPKKRPASALALQKMLESIGRTRAARLKRAGALAAALLAAVALGAAVGPAQKVLPTLVSVPQGVYYAFTSPIIEQAVRFQLDRPEGGITARDLAGMTKLFLAGSTPYRNWDDLSFNHALLIRFERNDDWALLASDAVADFRYLTNLQELSLYRLALWDLSFLENLPLTHLGLGGNAITDLRPLKSLKSLEVVNLCDNPIEDYSPLTEMESLKTVILSRYQWESAQKYHLEDALDVQYVDT